MICKMGVGIVIKQIPYDVNIVFVLPYIVPDDDEEINLLAYLLNIN